MTRTTRTQGGRAARLTVDKRARRAGAIARKASSGNAPDPSTAQAQPAPDAPARRTPAWLHREVRFWARVLGLQAWAFTVLVVRDLERPNWQASAQPSPHLSEAVLKFRFDIKPTPGWRRTVAHEVLHVAHARIDHLVEDRVASRLDPATADLARDVYTDALESFVELTAYALQRCDAGGRGAGTWGNKNKNKRGRRR